MNATFFADTRVKSCAEVEEVIVHPVQSFSLSLLSLFLSILVRVAVGSHPVIFFTLDMLAPALETGADMLIGISRKPALWPE